MRIATNKIADITRFYYQEVGTLYDKRELDSILLLIYEHYLGFTKTDLILKQDERVSESMLLKLNFAIKKIRKGMPVQYALGKAWFADMPFNVNESTLIPRPETEELVDWIIKDYKNSDKINILDIGTGSGCIAIALKKTLTNSSVEAYDISQQAIDTATQNAKLNNAEVTFRQQDILNITTQIETNIYDIIVSNPPYVTEKEKTLMLPHVLNHEPHTALFVDDTNPLLFYKAIAEFAKQSLKPNGALFFEINEQYGKETSDMLKEKGFKDVELRKDFFGKDRMMKALIAK